MSLEPRRLLVLSALALLAACAASHDAEPSSAAAAERVAPAPPSAHAPAHASEPGQGLTSAEALEAFDQAWQTIHDTHFDPTFNGVDWSALRDELRPRAERARTREEVREVIAEMLERLSQSHFVVIPAEALPDASVSGSALEDQAGGLGFDVRLREAGLLVVSVEARGAAAEAGVRPGWIVLRIGSFDAEQALARAREAGPALGERAIGLRMWTAAQGENLGPVGAQVRVVFRDGEEREVELALERRRRAVTAHNVGPTLPTFYLEFESSVLERGGLRVGYVRFSNWFLPVMQPLNSAIEGMAGRDGIVIDLRGNTGGAGAMTMGVAGHFFAETTRLGVMTTRDSTLNILALPRALNAAGESVQPFTGPVALVIDETTASASEVFAGGLQAVGRVRVFGSTSAGAVLPAMTTKLPNGDALLHAMGDFETAAGTRLEGAGVVPDETVRVERADLLAGRDAPLEAALAWIAGQGR